jgi:hypothetical protein
LRNENIKKTGGGKNRTMKKIFMIVMSLSVFSFAVVCFSAEAPAPPLIVKNYEGIPYVSGGIGLDEREAMSAIASEYNLKIVFALKEGNYLADASVLIKNAQGRTFLDAVSDGPWFYAKLPAGHYTVTATIAEKAENQAVEIKSTGHAVLHFYWTE